MKILRQLKMQKIKSRFARLYGRENADRLTERFAMMVGRYGVGIDTQNQTHGPLWDHNDVLFITYADMVRSEGERPLSSLRRFCTKRLKHLISTVHILPFCPWSSDDGFSVIDYRSVAPEYGRWDDVESLGAEFALQFDIVLNHCSAKSSWMRDFVTGIAPARDYFMTASPDADLSAVVRPRPQPLLHKVSTSDGDKWVWCTFSKDQADLNWKNPDLLFEFLDIIFLYLSKRARILRLDAIAFLWKEIGTSCLHLPQTHEVVKLIRDILDTVAPGTLLLTETNVPHEENLSYFGNGDEAHIVYNFALPPLLLHALLRGEGTQLTRWAASLEAPPKGCTFLNFTASHDGIGVRPLQGILDAEIPWIMVEVEKRGGRVSMKANADGTQSPYELNISYLSALSNPEAKDDEVGRARFICSQAIALSMQGIPAVYFNSVVGTPNWTEGVERVGGYNRAINRRKWDRAELDAQLDNPDSSQGKIFAAYQKMLRRRRDHTAFHPTAEMRVHDIGADYFAFSRHSQDGQESILCVFNLTDKERKIPIARLEALGLPQTGSARDIFSASTLRMGPNRNITLAPYQPAWLMLQ
ncbi:MAG: hypothetical protein JW942_03230 [Opitutales bacterium]|nr:hypothetical protein [Opitutales bacterium]